MKQAKKQGFTLVEIMIVVAIIGLLAAIGIPSILNAYNNSQENAKLRNVAEVEKAKGVLTLPTSSGLPGALGKTDVAIGATDTAAILEALRIESITDLDVDGTTISLNTMTNKASY